MVYYMESGCLFGNVVVPVVLISLMYRKRCTYHTKTTGCLTLEIKMELLRHQYSNYILVSVYNIYFLASLSLRIRPPQ